MAEQAIFDQLTAIPALGGRVYPLKLPQNVLYPAVSYQRISGLRISAFKRDATPVDATIQVDIYGEHGKGYEAFESIVQSVRAALQRQASGNAIDMFLTAERDDYEEDTELYRKAYDVRVWYRET